MAAAQTDRLPDLSQALLRLQARGADGYGLVLAQGSHDGRPGAPRDVFLHHEERFAGLERPLAPGAAPGPLEEPAAGIIALGHG